MPAPIIGALAARVGASVAAHGGASAIAKSAVKQQVLRSATSMGHGTSASQFAPTQPSALTEDPNYLNNNTTRWPS
jgi:hypothetical protein